MQRESSQLTVVVPAYVPEQFRTPSDAAKRCSEIITLAAIAGDAGKFMAIRLADGSSDRAVYDTREDAIRHQLHPEHCTYILVPPGGMPEWDAEAVLDYWRKLHDRGVRDDDPSCLLPVMPLTRRDQARQIRVLSKGRK